MTKQARRADMFMDLAVDPREGGPTLGDERATLVEFLRCQRLTLQIKCEGLDGEQLARRAVEPSTMSLLGLVRHMAEVERGWFRRRFAGRDVPKLYQSDDDPDGDFNGAVADQAVVGRRGQRGATRSRLPSNSRATPTSGSSGTTERAIRSPCANF